jgi:6-phosphogluconolactonase
MGTAAKYRPNIEIVSDAKTLAGRSVELFVSDAHKAVNAKGLFCAAISGGHTPKLFFELLAERPAAITLPWDKIQLFWVDERCVPPDSQWSNYRLAAETFLSKVAIPEDNVHRIEADSVDFEAAARRYEQRIRSVFGLTENRTPEFDLIVLGMGSDGHTGSLLPSSYACFDKDDLACVVYAMDGNLNRITLTHPVLCAASHLVVLVSGREKAAILKEVFASEPDEVRYPIHTLWPILHKVTWLVDSDAAEAI